MRKIFSLLLAFALVLSMGTTALAMDDTEGGEQPQEEEQQTTVTVSTLDELIAAITAAEDGDTIALSAEILLDGISLETDKDVTLVRADTYESGLLFRMRNGAVLNGFRIEDYKYSRTIGCESLSEIKNCSFVGDSEQSNTFIFISGLFTTAMVTVSDCSFSGAQNSAIHLMSNSQATIKDSIFRNNKSNTQGGAIRSSGTLFLENCTFTNNYAVSGGGVYSSGDLTITDCQFSGNQIESEKFGTDVFSNGGTLTITDSQTDGEGFYGESTGEKVILPLTDYASTAKLIYLTDADATVYFVPVEDENPDDQGNNEGENQNPTVTPTTPSEPPNEGSEEDTPDDQQPPSEPPVNPDGGEDDNTPADTQQPSTTPDDGEQDGSDDDDNEPEIIYQPVYIRVPVYIEREPEPVEPSLVCGDAVIDISRSVVLEGYDDGLLHLEDSLTSVQFMTILYRLLDADTIEHYESTDSIFADVAPDAWYCRYVTTIANAGIVCGTGNGNFDPEAKLTWGHIITILSRFVEPQGYQLQNIQYDGWALDAVETAVALGWIADYAAFNPDAAISRGELAYFVNYVLSLYR